MIIKDFACLKQYFRDQVKRPIFGIGVYAFNRLGLEDLIPDYQIIALRYSLDTALMEKDLKILSLEKGLKNKHLNLPRNSTTVISHQRTREHLSAFKEPVLITYKTSGRMENYCQQHRWLLANASHKFGKDLLENKIKFRQILETLNLPCPEGEICPISKLAFKSLKNRYGLPFVIQHPLRGGGKGTFFIREEKSFKTALKKLHFNPEDDEISNPDSKQVLAARFITGPSPSLTACVTRHGILSTNLQYQVLDMPELYNPKKGSGLFCGHDWTFSDFSPAINAQAYQAADRVGRYFKSLGYKGIFGLDFILDQAQQKLYIVECNPRLLGSFPTITMVQARNQEPLILGFHLLEFLEQDYAMDLNEINRLIRQEKVGAQMLIHNLSRRWSVNQNQIQPGVYKLEQGEMKFIRPGYGLKHLNDNQEFLITEGVPYQDSPFSPNRRLCRILTLNNVLLNYKHLTNWGSQIAQKTYQAFGLKPARFFSLKRFFNPEYLAKG